MANKLDAPVPTAALPALPSSSPSYHGEMSGSNAKGLSHSPDEEHKYQTVPDVVAPKSAHPNPIYPKSIPLHPQMPPKGCKRRARLNLLHLPNDILEIIIKDITHTNDLCALSLTCSALHSFAVPHIYSRFDIVWPDSTAHVDPKPGVDALTYGLSTLVMAEELFGEGPQQQQRPVQCEACGHVNLPAPVSGPLPPLPESDSPLHMLTKRRRRYGNHYAQYCRKFSLGNGPKEWVQDYMISREAGKLLGTQVALAVARMRNLESFVWDMPTGILHEVWMALASLHDRADRRPCRLERVWVRWHNNEQLLLDTELQDDGHAAENNHVGPHPSAGASMTGAFGASSSAASPTGHVSHHDEENFSILPPLRSLSVLDIDMANYLEQMAILIGRSRQCLRELRVGIAPHVDLSSLADDLASSTHSGNLSGNQRKLGGVLGALFAGVFCVTSAGILRGTVLQDTELNQESKSAAVATLPDSNEQSIQVQERIAGLEDNLRSSTPAKQAGSRSADPSTPASIKNVMSTPPSRQQAIENQTLPVRSKPDSSQSNDVGERLSLEVLELERVPLSVFTLREALDWSKLTEITLLDCTKHEQFWRALRRQFARSPTRVHTWQIHAPPIGTPNASKSPRSSSKPQQRASYALHIRKIHVNAVSPSLIAFTRDALAPDTLQTLFLHASSATDSQYNPGGTRHVSLDQIHRGPIRRHARSLTKLSIDSGLRSPAPHVRSTSTLAPSRRSWTLTRDILAYLTSGRLRALRELAVCLDHHDWHFFLQRLPALCHLRSLYIPQIHDRVTGRAMEALSSSANLHLSGAREFAQQVLDIVVLRPEVQLCYLGMFDKCFEILEGPAALRDAAGAQHDRDEDEEDEDGEEGSSSEDDEDDNDDDDNFDDIAQGHGHGHTAMHDATNDDQHDLHADDADDDDDDDDDDGDDADEADGALATETEDEGDEDEDLDEHGHAHGHGHAQAGHGYGDAVRTSSGDCIRLREILFYDDKVAIFRARLGRL